jgi:hypothetical protein
MTFQSLEAPRTQPANRRDAVAIALVRQPDDQDRVVRRREPVTFGVPFPPGTVRDAAGWCLVSDSGTARPAQTRVLETWPDGSIRWMLVDGHVDCPAGGDGRVRLEILANDGGVAPPPISLRQTADAVIVDTGAARFTLRTGSASLFDSVDTDNQPAIDAATSGIIVTDAAGVAHRATTTGVSVTESGPLRVRVTVNLQLPSGPLSELSLQARLDFFAGLASVRCALRVRNPRRAEHPGGFWDLGDAGSLFVKDLSLTIALPATDTPSAVLASIESGGPWLELGAPMEVYQDSSGGENWQSTIHINRERRVPNQFRGYRLRSAQGEHAGLRATPVVRLTAGPVAVAAAVPKFWQNFPRAIEADAAALSVRFFPGQYGDLHEIQGGEQKTHVCTLSFGDDAVTDRPLDWCRAPLIARAEPAWYLSAAAVPFLGSDDPGHAALIQPAVDGPDSFVRKREVVDQFGWRHFGDVYGDHEAVRQTGPMPLVSHYNNQYDPIAGFIYQFLRTGDARWWTMADELAQHVTDIDVYHTDRDKSAYNHGLFWHTYHYGDADTSSHRTYPRAALGRIHGGGPSAEHTYTTGLMLYSLLTGDQASRDAALELAEFVVNADDGRTTVLKWLSRAPTGYATASGSYDYHGPGRAPGNSLNTLLDGHRLSGDASFLAKAEEIIRRVVHPHADIGRHRLDDPERRWFYLMCLQSLGKYLWWKADRGECDAMYAYARASLLHYARWMADHEYPYLEKPEKLEFPTETWAAHEARKSDIFCHAALHAAGAGRERFLERARFFFRNAVETLGGMPTRTLARPVIVLLSSGLLWPWLAAHPDAAAPPPAAAEPDYGRPVPFVPQRAIARRRAVRLAALGALAGVAALIALAIRGAW